MVFESPKAFQTDDEKIIDSVKHLIHITSVGGGDNLLHILTQRESKTDLPVRAFMTMAHQDLAEPDGKLNIVIINEPGAEFVETRFEQQDDRNCCKKRAVVAINMASSEVNLGKLNPLSEKAMGEVILGIATAEATIYQNSDDFLPRSLFTTSV